MSQWLLVGKARSLHVAVLALAATALLTRFVGSRVFHLNRDESGTTVPWVVLAPLLSASVCGVLSRSSLSWMEAGASRPTPALRGLHVLVLVLVASLATLATTTAAVGSTLTRVSAERNLLGLTGLALLAGTVAGASMSWLLPFALAVATVAVGGTALYPWGWLSRPDGDTAAFATAISLLILGATSLTLKGAREDRQRV